jgi:nitronate monooxygenase
MAVPPCTTSSTPSFAHKALESGWPHRRRAGAGGCRRVLALRAHLEIREFLTARWRFGAISTGGQVLAAQAMGPLRLYRLRLHPDPRGPPLRTSKDMIVASAAKDIVYSSLFTGVHGNHLAFGRRCGMDPNNLPEGDKGPHELQGQRRRL